MRACSPTSGCFFVICMVGLFSVFCDHATDPASQPPTVGPGQILVTAPHGGETFHIGDSLRIRWLADTNSISNIIIYITINKMRTWKELPLESSISRLDPAWGDLNWKIPDSLWQFSCVSDSVAVMVADYASGGPRANSPLFRIRE